MESQEYILRAMSENYKEFEHTIDDLDIKVFSLAANEIAMQREYIKRLEKINR